MTEKNKRAQEINVILKGLGVEEELQRIELTEDDMKDKYGKNYKDEMKYPYYLGVDIYEGEVNRKILEGVLKIPEFSRIELWESDGIDEEGDETGEILHFLQLAFDGVEMQE
ncbi:MAG: hypothetical protein DKM50_09445 [Candidatus Margulisiibacteriota bacterium]|nr:MAG: hypothetical protein A2X43_11580 [Candidatus Margulisbacteria bacterium GWD2_39_127]OGI02348.1 MAG: hypothetical protein A2X42_09345 [Candidatus Margulisbacteria bacterium GWF2_38_17]OGI09954.1 MAG: hypothetical protein A2X41_12900 [Candidatus Margulisbacteria bacterium GWE2_39_32]PZM78993.1 MAG: hypothetical protein DKM50_09445 [Candidatus Margulisiibacteriota bacterium]HAR62580.1 hypothetical protein [Candidatus Margulisiibacteriota bacterium]